MIRDFPPDWAPARPPAQTPLQRALDALFDRLPWWDQALILLLFVGYLVAMCAVIVHLA